MSLKPLAVLLVEDNPADVRLTKEAFAEVKMGNTLDVVRDGVEAMAYLRRQGNYAAASRPDLLLLDLNLPRMDGREVLAQIKVDAVLRRIPVVVLTTSRAETDIVKSYSLHANCYITKPADFDLFVSVIRTIDRFWLAAVTLPPR